MHILNRKNTNLIVIANYIISAIGTDALN